MSGELSLPHAVALSWGIAERPERGPKRELSIERIVDSATMIADAEGLAALSMSRIATSLGFTTMSLYRYVTSKDDLLLLLHDRALELPIPPEPDVADWRGELREWVVLSRAAFAEHPWASEIAVVGLPLTPNYLRLLDWGLRSLRATTLSDGEKLATVLVAGGFARGFGVAPADQLERNYAESLRELVTEERYPYLRPLIESGAYGRQAGDRAAGSPLPVIAVGSHDEADFEVDFGLERYLDGVGHYLASHDGSVHDGSVRDDSARDSSVLEPAPRRDEASLRAAIRAADDRLAFYPKDQAVREAAAKRREAETRLREALKREREVIAKARERADKLAEKAAGRAAR